MGRLARIGAELAAATLVAAALAGTAGSVGPTGWKRTDIRPVSQPVSAGGLLLLYAASDDGLQLVALDPQTGATVWTKPATPSATARGSAPRLAGNDDAVVYLKQAGKLGAMAAIAPRTGAEL